MLDRESVSFWEEMLKPRHKYVPWPPRRIPRGVCISDSDYLSILDSYTVVCKTDCTSLESHQLKFQWSDVTCEKCHAMRPLFERRRQPKKGEDRWV